MSAQRARRMSRARRGTGPAGQGERADRHELLPYGVRAYRQSPEDVFVFAEQAAAHKFKRNYGPVRHNSEPPHGDGETGGNVACYFYDPDYHNVEFCGAMDTIENYRERYGDKKGSERA